MDLQSYFTENRPLILFLYGLVFFVLGLAIFLQSRQRSQLQFARDLRWLAAFGILHGLHEWGLVFIPIQASYLPKPLIEALLVGQVLLLVLSFVFLLFFGYALLRHRYARLRLLVIILIVAWLVMFVLTRLQTNDVVSWMALSTIWSRYLLGFPAAALSAYGLYVVAPDVAVIGGHRFFNMLRLAGYSLAAYAIFGGLTVPYGPFFPANTLNTAAMEALFGIPVEIFRSVSGLVLTISMIRALEIFDIETDRLIEQMEVEALRAAERERIGQEIHDGALQGVYAVGLFLGSLTNYVEPSTPAGERLAQAQSANEQAIYELRRYMNSLRSTLPERPLAEELAALLTTGHFDKLVGIDLEVEVQPLVSTQSEWRLLAIVREAMANVVRHSNASHVSVRLMGPEGRATLQIIDNGQGFDPTDVNRGYGLQSIEDHALLMETTVEINSAPGKGTSIIVPIPNDG